MNKEVNEKKKKYAIVITFLVLMICITGGTYAYFALTASNNSVTGSVGGASLNLEVTKVYPTSEHNSKNMIPQLESTLDEAISTDHKCVDGNGNVICQVYSATVTNVGSTTSVLNGTISFTGIENMPNLKWMRINDSNTLGTYSSFNASTDKALFEEERRFGANTSNTYYFVIWINETGELQTDSGTFRANIKFESTGSGLSSSLNGDGGGSGSTTGTNAATYVMSLYDSSRATTVNIGGDTSKPTVSLDSTSSIMLDNNGEYRYYGANPNNYVEYNGELWRIINVANVKSSKEDTVGSQRLRIIRNESIGLYAWDVDTDGDYNNATDDSESNWETATLNKMLNGIYYNRTSGTCYKGEALWDSPSALECDYENGSVKGLSSEARSLIGDAVWYLGVSSTYEGLYADDYYNSERGTKVPLEEFPTSTVAKLGIMYPSDYVYAVDLSKNIRTGDEIYEVEILEEEIEEIHWLYGSYEWLISPFSFNGHATMISWRNIIMWDSAGETDVNVATYVRPVAVLKPNVMITGGSGTSGEPYRLVLG